MTQKIAYTGCQPLRGLAVISLRWNGVEMPNIQRLCGFQGRLDVQLIEQQTTYRARLALAIALSAMVEANDVYAVALLSAWFQEHHGFFYNKKIKSEFKATGHGSALVRLESTHYMAEVCVWNRASCMDVQILEIATEKSTFPHVGECTTRLEFESELSKFLEWIKNDGRIGI